MNQTTIKELLTYDKSTGLMQWKLRDVRWFKDERSCKGWNTKYAGTNAGTTGVFNGKKYRVIRIFGKSMLMHRVIWLYVRGAFPLKFIDHANGDGTDNRWFNISESDYERNNKNMKLFRTNTSGCSGVHWCNRDKHWIARISGKEPKRLGYFKDRFEAICARKSAEIKYNFHPNHGQVRPL